MDYRAFILLAALVGCRTPPPSQPVAPTPVTSISWNELNERPVIGRLGQPLGQLFDIEATVAEPDNSVKWAYSSHYRLAVTRVNGRPLPTPVMMLFDPDWLARTFPQTLSDVDKLGPSTRPFVGRNVYLTVWESGAFGGAPEHPTRKSGLDLEFASQGATAFYFHTELHLMIDRDDPDQRGVWAN